MTRKTAISPQRHENYPEWYQEVIKAADLAETSPVRGCMIIKPWGYAIWENMQADLDKRFKETGHVNAYFPLLIPMSFLEKEAEHVEGFAKECAVVTHTRLEDNGEGGLKPASPLEEPYIIRPTSETIIGHSFAKWIQSHRDLPLKINQWANVMRWEMRTRLFLRTSEFLWQEGHTAHASAEEAMHETLQMLDVYAAFAESMVALPVIKGEKTAEERFPGAVNTYTIETMMQDKKALQAGTSHFLGQNFAKSFGIQFTDHSGALQHAYTTSWGMTTRMIGAMIMTHSDDDGLVIPPRIAPQHIVIIPVVPKPEHAEQVFAYCDDLAKAIAKQSYFGSPIRVFVDKREMNGGEKTWDNIKKGVPIRLEIGPRDMEKDSVFMARRDKDVKDKQSLSKTDFVSQAASLLDDIQQNLLQRARAFRDDNTQNISSLDTFKKVFEGEETPGFVQCFCHEAADYADIIKPLKVTARCVPFENNGDSGVCIFSGEKTQRQVIFAKAY